MGIIGSSGPYENPEDLEEEFPEAVTTSFEPIKTAPYKYVDPLKFAQQWGTFNRAEILKNYDIAKQIALQELDTELAGLTKYAPAAAALKQAQTAADNRFNQQQKSEQFDANMPGVREQLTAQGKQATELAKGKVPDFLSDAEDRALELGIRSRSADNSMAGGFGASSSVAKKASDLMSAETRYNMNVQKYQLGLQQTQYGNSLLGQNIQTKAGLYLAPLENMNAGSEIRSVPEVGAGRLAASALSETNQLSMIPTELAFRSDIQQEQYKTSLEQQTRMFNASGEFEESKANAGIENQFALDKFGYQVGYAGVTAGTETANNLNAQGLQQQAQAGQIFQDYASQAQQAQQVGAVAQGVGAVIPAAAQVVNGVAGLFNSGNTPTDSGGTLPSWSWTPSSSGGSSGGGYLGGGGSSGGGVDTSGSLPSFSFTPPATESGGGGVSTTGAESNYTLPTNLDYSSSLDIGGDSGYLFKQATGLQYNGSFNPSAAATLRMAGVTKDPTAIPGSVNIGSDYNGAKVYSDAKSLTNTNPIAGQLMGETLAQILFPLGAFNEEDMSKLNNISKVAGDPQLMSSLDQSAAQGNAAGFINTTLTSFNKGTIEDIAARGKDGDIHGAATAYTAHQAMQSWPQLSRGQKSILVGSMGLKATDFGNGKTLGDKVIPNTTKAGTQPVTIAKAVDWFSKGINAYPLTRKWDQFSTIAKVMSGKNDPDTVANISNQFKLLGAGINGAEVPGVTLQNLQRAGWTPITHLGVGAIGARSGALLPKGYVKIADDGQRMVAAPAGTAYSAKGAVMKSTSANDFSLTTPGAASGPFNFTNAQSSEAAQGAQNVLNWGTGAYNIYAMWHGKPGVKPALGTAAVVAQNVDSYNATQGEPSSYGQAVGSAAQLYAAYDQARQGNYVRGAAFGTAGAFNGMAAWARANGNDAAAAQYGQYAGYAQAGVNFYGAYNSWEQGDKPGAAVQAVGGAAELAGFGGAGLAASGAYTGYRAYGTGNVAQGALGGSMMLAGSVMLIGGPAGWAVGGALMAASVLGSAFTTGTTNKEHIARNGFRDYLQGNTGLLDGDNNITLADGTQWNAGDENARHSVAHPEGLVGDNASGGKDDRSGSDSLRAYDCDYTNDLDFTSTMAGQTLTRLLGGRADTATDQMGTMLGNAGIANIGYGQEMNQANFDKMVANQRAFYARAGIGSKNDGYQLANAAFAEGRINEMQHTQAIQALDIVFDKAGFDTAQKLMSGRNRGVETAQAAASEKPVTTINKPKIPTTQSLTKPVYSVPSVVRSRAKFNNMTKDEIRTLNASRYQLLEA